MKSPFLATPALVYFTEKGERVQLIDSHDLCKFLGVAKPHTLMEMAYRGDLPAPVYLNMSLRGKKGRNQVRWDLAAVMRHIGLAAEAR